MKRLLVLLPLTACLAQGVSSQVPSATFTPVPPLSPATATPEAPPDPPPPGFEIREQFGKVCRIDRKEFPWQLYSAEPQFQPAVVHAVNCWNQAGLGLLYELAQTPDGADLIVDWSGSSLPPQRASAVWWDANLGRLNVLGLTMDGRMNVPLGNLAQLLMHELGHPLGLGHSQDPRDIMFETMHRTRYNQVTGARLSERDVAALQWLYRQNKFVPIRGRRAKR